jgi:EmrB/QacA subfamily drug resistance transporter
MSAASPAARPPRLVNPSPNRTLLVLAAGGLAYALAQTMIVPALPEIQRTFGGDPADATWLLTAFLLTAAVATPLFGRLGDMYGKEHWLLLSLGIFGLGSVVSAVAGSLGVMIAGRAIQGAGGAIFPLAIGIIRDEFPREKVATGIGTISAMFGIGGGVGLVVAGVLVDGIGVAWIFWLSAAAAAVAAWATWKYVPESPVRVHARIDWFGAILLSAALASLLLGVSEGNVWGWGSARVLGLFLGSAALTGLWAAWEWRVTDPLVDLRLMRRRPVWTTNVAAFAIGFAMFGSFVLIPQLVQTPARAGYGFGASVTASGLFLLPSALVMLFAGPVSGRLGARFGSKLPLALGAVFAAAGYFWLAALHDANIDIYLGSVLLGIGIRLAFAAMANLTVEAVPANMTGIASAINAIMRQIGGAIGAQVAAAIVSAHLILGGRFPAESGYTTAFAMSGVGAIVALFVTFAIPARVQSAPERPAPAAASEPAASEAAASDAAAAEALS